MVTKLLYEVRQIAWLTLGNQGERNMNLGWGDADFIIHKGVFSELEFIIRNVDRKPVNLNGKRLFATLINDETEELYLERELYIDDYVKGRCKLILTPSDSIDWNRGTIRYSVNVVNIDTNIDKFLFNDLNQEAVGYIELRDTAKPKPFLSQVFTEFTPVLQDQITTYYYSGIARGPASYAFINSLTTLAVYFDNFTGNFIVEGTAEPLIDTNTVWTKIRLRPDADEIQYRNKSGIDAYNIVGNYSFYRFSYYQEPFDDGTITKVLVN